MKVLCQFNHNQKKVQSFSNVGSNGQRPIVFVSTYLDTANEVTQNLSIPGDIGEESYCTHFVELDSFVGSQTMLVVKDRHYDLGWKGSVDGIQ